MYLFFLHERMICSHQTCLGTVSQTCSVLSSPMPSIRLFSSPGLPSAPLETQPPQPHPFFKDMPEPLMSTVTRNDPAPSALPSPLWPDLLPVSLPLFSCAPATLSYLLLLILLGKLCFRAFLLGVPSVYHLEYCREHNSCLINNFSSKSMNRYFMILFIITCQFTHESILSKQILSSLKIVLLCSFFSIFSNILGAQ